MKCKKYLITYEKKEWKNAGWSNVEPISSSRPQQFNYKVLVGMLALSSSLFPLHLLLL